MTRRSLLVGSVVPAIAGAPSGHFVFNLLTGKLVESTWENLARPAATGSLLKIVPAVAHALRHSGRFPEHDCQGLRSGCWSPAPHGRVDITQALAHSCNAYFRSLASALPQADVNMAASALGINGPASDQPEDWIGLNGNWRVKPLGLLSVYARVIDRRHEPNFSALIQGLRACAVTGTGRALGGVALAKTGTAGCEHAKKSPGDGWALALWPPESPRYGAVARACGEPGSHVAGRLKAAIKRFV